MDHSKKMKGFEPLIAAVLLVAIALMAGIIIYQWQISYIDSQTSSIQDSTQKRLSCERADISYINASYDCKSTCNAGTEHMLKIKLRNFGDVGINVEKVYLKNKTGSLYEYPGGRLEIGEIKEFSNISTLSCQGISKNIDEILVITECRDLFLSIPGDKINWINC